jgi:hypothetical protein
MSRHWGLRVPGPCSLNQDVGVGEEILGCPFNQDLIYSKNQTHFHGTLFLVLSQEVQMVLVTPALGAASMSSLQPGE